MFENIVQTDSGRYFVQVRDLDAPDLACTFTQAEVDAIRRYLLSKVSLCLDAENDCRKMDPLGGSLAVRDELRDWQQKRATIEFLLGQLPMPVRKKAAKAAAKAIKAKAKARAKASEKVKAIPKWKAKPTLSARKALTQILTRQSEPEID